MKKIVCRCHDITEEDIEAAIDAGYDDLETLKRITGVTTGFCQGKTCLPLVLDILRRRRSGEAMKTIVIRPPIDPIPLSSL